MTSKKYAKFKKLRDKMHELIHEHYKACIRNNKKSDGEHQLIADEMAGVAVKMSKYKGGFNET